MVRSIIIIIASSHICFCRARIASAACPEYPVTVTHDYDIFVPFRYRCIKCLKDFGRHSRIKDLQKVKCGRKDCGGDIE